MRGSSIGYWDDDFNWVSNWTLFDPEISAIRTPSQQSAIDSATLSAYNDAGEGKDARVHFTPSTSGTYYIDCEGASGWTGTYQLTIFERYPTNPEDARPLTDADTALR